MFCPMMNEVSTCMTTICAVWDEKRQCCSFNTKAIEIVELEEAAISNNLTQFIQQLKSNIDLMLNEKTGWGRVELKTRLFNTIDNTGKFDTFKEADEDLPF